MRNKEKSIEKYHYYFGSSRDFIKERFDNFKEMEDIIQLIFKSIQKDMKNYNVSCGLDGCCIMIENKKTKESYRVDIGF